jgi:hypothetical protein
MQNQTHKCTGTELQQLQDLFTKLQKWVDARERMYVFYKGMSVFEAEKQVHLLANLSHAAYKMMKFYKVEMEMLLEKEKYQQKDAAYKAGKHAASIMRDYDADEIAEAMMHAFGG